VQALATKVSEQANASLRLANSQVAALTAQMEARRKAARAELGVPRPHRLDGTRCIASPHR